MTIDPLSSSSSALSSLSGVSPTAGAMAAAGARSLALGVASEVGSQLLAPLSGPVVTGQGAPPTAGSGWPQPQPYEIAAMAEVLGRSLDATPMEIMDMEQALQGLAGAVAADFVALADGRTLERLDSAIDAIGPGDGPASATAVVKHIEDIAAHLAAAS